MTFFFISNLGPLYMWPFFRWSCEDGRMGFPNRLYYGALAITALIFSPHTYASVDNTVVIDRHGNWITIYKNASGSYSADIQGNIRRVSDSKSLVPLKKITIPKVPISPSSIGKMAKAAMGGPLGVAITAALIAGNAAWDDYSKSWTKPSGDYSHGTTLPNINFDEYLKEGWFYTRDPDSIPTICDPFGGFVGYQYVTRNSHPYIEVVCGNGPTFDVMVYQKEKSKTPVLPPTSLSDSDVGTIIGNNPSLVRDLVTDTWTNPPSPNPDQNPVNNPKLENWPEAKTAIESAEKAINNYNSQNSPSDTNVPNPEVISNSPSDEWPAFCSWAQPVCNFIDWAMSEPTPEKNPDLPVEEVSAKSWNSGLGGGSCPAPITTSFQGKTISYDFEPACMAAHDYFRPLLIALSLVAATIIIAGAKTS